MAAFTPLQIKEANLARLKLRKIYKSLSAPILHDDRLVKRPASPYMFFVQERFATGDFSGIAIGEAGKLMGTEWKGLSASAKKVRAVRLIQFAMYRY